MKLLTDIDKKNICKEYINGSSIKELYKKYNIGDRRVRKILIENNIEINNVHKITKSNDDYIEKNQSRFNEEDGYKYVAVLKTNKNICFDDYLNKSGVLTSYIKNELNLLIKNQEYDKLKYLYYECFDEKESKVSNIVKKINNCIDNNLNFNYMKIYNILKMKAIRR